MLFPNSIVCDVPKFMLKDLFYMSPLNRDIV